MNILNVGYASTNYYLIGESTPRLLVDVGWPGTLGKLRAEVERYSARLEAVTHLLVTHYHPDHAGLTEDLKTLGVKLILLEAQVPFVARLGGYMKPEHPFQPISATNTVLLSFASSRDLLQLLGLEGQIVPTPGHSEDSVSLVLDSGMAFIGDLPHPVLAADHPEVLASWARLEALGVRTVYPGHGPVLRLG